jgi:hypothetical protein
MEVCTFPFLDVQYYVDIRVLAWKTPIDKPGNMERWNETEGDIPWVPWVHLFRFKEEI